MTPTTATPTRLLPHLSTLLLDHHLLIFLLTTLFTGFVSLILSSSQTVRPFFPQDASLWHVHTHDTIPTALVFVFHYFLLTPLIHRIALLAKLPSPATLALGMPSATMLAVLIVEMGKGFVGRLRPSFATLCLGEPAHPAWTSLPPILSDLSCPTLDKAALHDARRSFPSGHAALAVCGAAYFQLCLLRAAPRIEGRWRRLTLYALGWVAMVAAAWVAASRVFDNAHHVGDVAVGSLIGLWTAGVHFWFVVGEIERERETKEE